MNVSDKIAEWLNEKGITTAFGIVGGGNVALWDALTRLGKTQIISTHHEQAAVMAASAYYQISRRISVALVTTGAGSTNAITGVVAAYMDSVPVIVMSGNEASKYLDGKTRVLGVQGYCSTDLIRPMTKYAARASSFDWRIILDGCYEKSLKQRTGPTWCDVPKDVQNAIV